MSRLASYLSRIKNAWSFPRLVLEVNQQLMKRFLDWYSLAPIFSLQRGMRRMQDYSKVRDKLYYTFDCLKLSLWSIGALNRALQWWNLAWFSPMQWGLCFFLKSKRLNMDSFWFPNNLRTSLTSKFIWAYTWVYFSMVFIWFSCSSHVRFKMILTLKFYIILIQLSCDSYMIFT